MPNILYASLAEANDKPVEILRIGNFTDSTGQNVEITGDDLDAFIANFDAGKAGQDVPIDINHDREEAGGWLVRLERKGNKLLGFVDWNELGTQLVGDKVYRYLSATIDLAGKFLRSVSLVNFPAIKGLKPVELSEGSIAFDQQGFFETIREILTSIVSDTQEEITLSNNSDNLQADLVEEEKTMDEKELAKLTEKIRNEEEQRAKVTFAASAAKEAELREQIRAEIKETVEAELREKFERRQGFVEFAEKMCNGNEAGLSVKPEDIVSLLDKQVDDDAVETLKTLLSAKIASFKEIGSNGDGKKELPVLHTAALKEVLTGQMTVQELINCKAVDGTMADYDLSALSAEQIGATL